MNRGEQLAEVLLREGKYTPADIQEIRKTFPMWPAITRDPMGAINARVGLQLWEANMHIEASIRKLDDTSTTLINTTNELSRKIYLLTWVSVGLGIVAAFAAVCQLFHIQF